MRLVMLFSVAFVFFFFFFQAEDGIRDYKVTGVQTCALPILGRGAAGAHRGAGAREELRGHGCVSRGPGRGGGGAAAGGGAGAGLRRALSGAARCDAARAPRPGVRARDARGDDVRVGAAPRGRGIRGVRAPRAHGGGSGDARRERVRGGRGGVFPHRAHGRHTADGRGGRAGGKGARRCLRSGDPRASSGGSPGSSAPGRTWRSSSWRSAARGGSTRADRKSTRLNSSHLVISDALFCLKKKNIPTKLCCTAPVEFVCEAR